MAKSRKDCAWARPNCFYEYEPPSDAAIEMVCLYHAALSQQPFSPIFKFIDESASINELIARAAARTLFRLEPTKYPKTSAKPWNSEGRPHSQEMQKDVNIG